MNKEDAPDKTLLSDIQSLSPELPLIIPMEQKGRLKTAFNYRPKRKSFKDWSIAAKIIAIAFVIVFIVTVQIAGFLIRQYCYPHPKLDAEPPAGWRVASGEEMDRQQESVEPLGSEAELDYLFLSDTYGEYAMVFHEKEFHIFQEPLPDTDDIVEMESWLSTNQAALKDKMESNVGGVVKSVTVEGIYVVKLAQDGVAIQVDVVTVSKERTTYTTFFYINERGTAFVARLETINEPMDTNLVEFIVNNLRFE